MSNPIVTLEFASVEYDAESATMTIDELMELLEEAREEGATHVVGLTGNVYGAKYARIRAEVDFGDDDED